MFVAFFKTSALSADGKYFSQVCKKLFTPWQVTPDAICTGTISQLITLFLNAFDISSYVKSTPEKYLSINSSSDSATASINCSLTGTNLLVIDSVISISS